MGVQKVLTYFINSTLVNKTGQDSLDILYAPVAGYIGPVIKPGVADPGAVDLKLPP